MWVARLVGEGVKLTNEKQELEVAGTLADRWWILRSRRLMTGSVKEISV